MSNQKNNLEHRILIVSALLSSGFALGGLFFGILVSSLVIMFDGVYSLISLLLTLLSLAASHYTRSSDSSIDRAFLEPVVIAFKASVILFIVGYSLYSSLTALFTGGREINTSVATLFGIISTVGCGFAWWFIVQKSTRFSSGLIEAETKQWQMDTLLSVAVMVGFILAWGITLSPWAEVAVYADPIMMLLMSFYFIKIPCGMLASATRDLMAYSSNQTTSAISYVN